MNVLKYLQNHSVTTVVIVVAVVLIVHSFLKRVYENQLETFLQNEKYDAFDAICHNFITILVVPAYRLEYYKLTSYLMREDRENIDVSFKKLIKFSSRKNRVKILKQAFNYYINVDGDECREILEQIEKCADESTARECRTLYSIVVNKESRYIDEMLEEYKSADEQRKAVLEYLLYLQYQNKGDKKNASKYEALSHKHFESFNQQL